MVYGFGGSHRLSSPQVLALLWTLAKSDDCPTDTMDQALAALIKILDYSCSQDRDKHKMEWINRFIEELKVSVVYLSTSPRPSPLSPSALLFLSFLLTFSFSLPFPHSISPSLFPLSPFPLCLSPSLLSFSLSPLSFYLHSPFPLSLSLSAFLPLFLSLLFTFLSNSSVLPLASLSLPPPFFPFLLSSFPPTHLLSPPSPLPPPSPSHA